MSSSAAAAIPTWRTRRLKVRTGMEPLTSPVERGSSGKSSEDRQGISTDEPSYITCRTSFVQERRTGPSGSSRTKAESFRPGATVCPSSSTWALTTQEMTSSRSVARKLTRSPLASMRIPAREGRVFLVLTAFSTALTA